MQDFTISSQGLFSFTDIRSWLGPVGPGNRFLSNLHSRYPDSDPDGKILLRSVVRNTQSGLGSIDVSSTSAITHTQRAPLPYKVQVLFSFLKLFAAIIASLDGCCERIFSSGSALCQTSSLRFLTEGIRHGKFDGQFEVRQIVVIPSFFGIAS